MNNELCNTDFNLIESFSKTKTIQKQKQGQLIQRIDVAVTDASKLYWYTRIEKNADEKNSKECIEKLDTAIEYLEATRKQLDKSFMVNACKCTFPTDTGHNIYQLPLRRTGKMHNYLLAWPFVQFNEIQHTWNTFIECSSFKTAFACLGAVLSLILGDFSAASWALVVLAAGHFVMRFWANKVRHDDTYVTFSHNIQLFFWPFFLLAIGNALSHVISINLLPEGTLLGLVIYWLIWGELKGIIENAELVGLTVPPIFKRIFHHDGRAPF